jgi:hypothetical protein
MKIAIVGGAPSSASLAPYGDESWEIWGCSPSSVPVMKRSTAWFELHPWVPGVRQSTDFMVHLGMHKGPVYMIAERREVPTSVVYPKDEMLAEFGPYFFSSSIAWMLALAISRKPEEIGLWGVDMQANTEYEHQRPGCHHFIQIARGRGIKITVPPESDILCPMPLYGFGELDQYQVKLKTKQDELKRKVNDQNVAARNAELKSAFFKGALDMCEYMQRTELK